MTDRPDPITLALMAGAEQARAIAQLSDTVAQQAQLIAELSAELTQLRDAAPASREPGTLDD